MTGHILESLGRNPLIINGAVMLNYCEHAIGNVRLGDGPCVIECDESDGTIDRYSPTVSVIANISLDHKSMDELRELFQEFSNRTTTAVVINLDCPESSAIDVPSTRITFSLSDSRADICLTPLPSTVAGACFGIRDIEVQLQVPGRHNIANAAAAIAAARALGLDSEDAAASLTTFKGTKRRLQTVGTRNGITIIDDFAHNPDKISASLQALHESAGRLILCYQPHVFGPTRMLKAELIDAFSRHLNDHDVLCMPEIFYSGGTARKDISSRDLIDAIADAGKETHFFETRDDCGDFMTAHAATGDRLVVMGARDDSLTLFAEALLRRLR
jgi:UDP-N-acetylmuramate--alanine ligase